MSSPVRLKYAFNKHYAVSGMSYYWSEVIVKVKNLAFQKYVAIRFRHANGSWGEEALT